MVPDYTPISSLDMIQTEYDSITPGEAQLLSEVLGHFFFTKFESTPGDMIKERIDQLNKVKPQSATTLNKKHLFDLNIPLKLRKALHRFSQKCLESMKKNKEDWYTCGDSRYLKKIYPSILDYRDKFLKADRHSSEMVEGSEEEKYRRKFMKVLGLKEIPLSSVSVSLLHELMMNVDEDWGNSTIEYLWLGGEKLEISRMSAFLRIMTKTMKEKDRSDIVKRRSLLTGPRINSNGIGTLMTLMMYFYDIDNSGKLLFENSTIATEPMDKVKTIVEQLRLYEQVGKISITSNGIMESPMWFFFSIFTNIRVVFNLLELRRAIHRVPVFQRVQILLQRTTAAHGGIPRNERVPVRRLEDNSNDLFAARNSRPSQEPRNSS